MIDCYTGFKWVAREIRELEGKKKYIGGGEESFGFLAADFIRDKDSVSACCLISEIAAWAKDQGKSLYEMLQDIYLEYGFSKEKVISVVRKGKSGAEEIKAMMTEFRNNPPKTLGGSEVVRIHDYQSLEVKDLQASQVTKLDMPDTSNVLQFFTADGSKASVRPSGTEPKIKFYIEVKGEMNSRADYDQANKAGDAKIAAICKDLGI